ncbi:hypothetical protein HU200_036514 [Digitaria exilis]|uniref:Uncharacterized protein n=1 Tax=Digitaria exilis TaxID=1010633 RepID=A0A835BS96_9POAL|nr:hypothetical protein HU200_036514 [Digitaria exilis]
MHDCTAPHKRCSKGVNRHRGVSTAVLQCTSRSSTARGSVPFSFCSVPARPPLRLASFRGYLTQIARVTSVTIWPAIRFVEEYSFLSYARAVPCMTCLLSRSSSTTRAVCFLLTLRMAHGRVLATAKWVQHPCVHRTRACGLWPVEIGDWTLEEDSGEPTNGQQASYRCAQRPGRVPLAGQGFAISGFKGGAPPVLYLERKRKPHSSISFREPPRSRAGFPVPPTRKPAPSPIPSIFDDPPRTCAGSFLAGSIGGDGRGSLTHRVLPHMLGVRRSSRCQLSVKKVYIVEDLQGGYATPPKMDPEHEQRLKTLQLM